MTQQHTQQSPPAQPASTVALDKATATPASRSTFRGRLLIQLIIILISLFAVGGWLIGKGGLPAIPGLTVKAGQNVQPATGNNTGQNPAGGATSSSATPAISEADRQQEFLLVNKLRVQMGMSQRYLESKLGIPQEKYRKMHIWQLPNGNRFVASFDEDGLTDATLSGSNPADYFSYYGGKVTLNSDSISTIEKKINDGCYHFGWSVEYAQAEYVVRGGPEGSWLINFGTYGEPGNDRMTASQLKQQKIKSISFGYNNSEPTVEQQYCNGEGQNEQVQPAAAPQALPHYSGNPQSDNAFNQFIKQHTGQVVTLDISIQGDYERELITYGYRGVSPTFSTVQNRNFDYAVFINCEEINNSSAEDSIGKCSPAVQWNPDTGKLRGTFRIDAKGRNDMKQSLIELVAVPAA